MQLMRTNDAHSSADPSALRPGEHLCWAFDDDERFTSSLAAFVSAGLAARQRVACYLTDDRVDPFEASLRAAFPETEDAVRDGSLVLGGFTDAYLPEGEFDPDARIDDYAEMARDALEDGYDGLRVAGEATVMVNEFPDEWTAYEIRADLLTARLNLVACCAFDVRVCELEALTLLRAVHAKAYGGPEGEPVFHVRAGRDGALTFAGEIDAGNSTIVQSAATRAAMDVESRTLDVGELRFADVSGVRAVAATAQAIGGDGPVSIVGASPIFRRVWSLLGFDREVNAELVG